MFIVLRLAKLALEFGSDLIQQFIEARGSIARRDSRHTAMRVHRHICDTPKRINDPLYGVLFFFFANDLYVMPTAGKGAQGRGIVESEKTPGQIAMAARSDQI